MAINFQEHLTQVMKWHFSDTTGTPFWLDKRRELGFDPIKDVRSFQDLTLFSDVSLELRDVDVKNLQPRGLVDYEVTGIFESGGTTGPAKRVIVYEQWLEKLIAWRMEKFNEVSESPVKNTLAIIPTGPHLVGAINSRRAKAFGGHCFTIDMDPRWVKKLIKDGDTKATRAYTEHLVDQSELIVTSQSIDYLIATPSLLEAISRRPYLREYLDETLEMITWGGTQMDVDTLAFLKTSVFPNVTITASYGSTMILSDTKARLGEEYNGAPIFDSFAPYVMLEVVNPNDRKPVSFHERGQVLMNHVSKYALFPNILERDTALRIPRANDDSGVAVSDIKPISTIAGQCIIEGVY